MTSPKPVPTDEAVSAQTFPKPPTDKELGEAIADASAKLDAMLAELQERASKLPFQPHVAPGSTHALYQVHKGESLEGIAHKLGLANPYHELFQPNMAEIEKAAKENGHPGGSDQGSILIPGIWLEYTPNGAGKPE